MCFLGVLLYQQFARKTKTLYAENSEQLLNQTAISLEDYLRNMRRISDAMYYSVIKDKDLAIDGLDEEMDLLYEANKDNLISIACYAGDGKLVAAASADVRQRSPGRSCSGCGKPAGKLPFFHPPCTESL